VPEAYDAYLRAREILYTAAVMEIPYARTQELLELVIRLDPQFANAYALLVRLHSAAFWGETDRTPARVTAAKAALDEAFRLQPNLPEAHLAAGYYYYWVRHDYDHAMSELRLAEAALPGSSEVQHLMGTIDRRQGKLEDAIQHHRRAAELDPARALPRTYLANSLHQLERYEEASRMYREALALSPSDPATLRWYGDLYIDWRGTTDTLKATLNRTLPSGRGTGGAIHNRFRAAMLERDCHAAAQAVVDTTELVGNQSTVRPIALLQAWAAHCLGDERTAKSLFLEAERVSRREITKAPNRPAYHASLGHALAGLNRSREAVEAGRAARSLRPYEGDALDGSYFERELAAIYTTVGEHDEAVKILERQVHRPFGISVNELLLDPRWDPLRAHPRFRALLRN
jgi:tetratricopeptide (TPR) repeat protein